MEVMFVWRKNAHGGGCLNLKRSILQGDTLIEVMFAVGIFGLVAISAISLMNRGLQTSQRTLETTMARQEIDTQAEALRFIHEAYISEESMSENPYAELWEKIIEKSYSTADLLAEVPDFYSGYNGSVNSCASLYENLPKNSFVINPRMLDALDIGNMINGVNGANLSDAIISPNPADEDDHNLHTSATYPRLLYGIEFNNSDDNTLSDADSSDVNYSQSFYSAEGIWVTAVQSDDGLDCASEGGDFRPDFYDFYIRTCWDSPGGHSSNTVGSTVRLYNSDQIDLNLNPVQEITFSNVEWVHFNNTSSSSSCGSEPREHVIASEKSIEFHGYTAAAMNEGVSYTIESSDGFDLEANIDTSTIKPHPGGSLDITLGVLTASLGQNGGSILLNGNTITTVGSRFKLKMSVNSGHYEVLIDDVTVGATDESSSDPIEIKFAFKHGGHCCSQLSHAYIKDIEMTQYLRRADDPTTACGTSYKPSYTVVFNPNGGTGSMLPVTFVAGEHHNLPANTFFRSGFAFSDWNTVAGGSGQSFADQALVEDLTDPGQSITLYAQWREAYYDIIFDPNGGEGTMDNLHARRGANVRLTRNTFTRENYHFAGWNTAADGSGTPYSDYQQVTDLAEADQSIVLFAQWAPDTYQVIFRPNGGTPNTNQVQVIDRGVPTALNPNVFSRQNYTFTGWNTLANGNGTHYDDGEVVTNLTTRDRSVVLYAEWNHDSYTIHYDGNGATSGTVADQTGYLGSSVTLANNSFSRENYHFVGWNTEPNGSGTSYSARQSVINLAASGETITLYAMWGRDTYQVIFRPNGGNGTNQVQTIEVDTPTNLRTNTFTRDGNRFTGWNTKANGSGTSYIDGQTVTNLTTRDGTFNLYAQWGPSQFYVDVNEVVDGVIYVSGKDGFTFSVYVDDNLVVSAQKDFYRAVPANSSVRVLADSKAGYELTNGDVTQVANGTLEFNPTWTAGHYEIIFLANDGTSSRNVQQATVGASVALVANVFQRTGFTFMGWNTKADGTGTAYSNRQTVTDLAPMDSSIRLYAQWRRDQSSSVTTCSELNLPAMQNWTDTLNVGETLELCDSRDLSVYPVAKLADGKVWMAKNLQLNFANLKQSLSSSNTNNPESTFTSLANNLPAAANTGFATTTSETFKYNTVKLGGTDCPPAVTTENAVCDDFGIYYNWYTATAGHGTSAVRRGHVAGDICPSGWHLPTGGQDGEFVALDAAIGHSGFFTSPANFLYAGYIGAYREVSANRYGLYWSSTANDASTVYDLYLFNGDVDPGTSVVERHFGYSVRCVLGDYPYVDLGTYQIIFRKNDGTTDHTVQQVNVGDTVSLTPNPWTRTGYAFTGWNTEADGSGTYFSDGASVYDLAERDEAILLYAQWELVDPQTCTDLGIPAMQNWGNTLNSTGDTTNLCDSRDLTIYPVTRLADGNVWMTADLNFDVNSAYINSSNTHHPTTSFVTDASNNTLCLALNVSCLTNMDRVSYVKNPDNGTGQWYPLSGHTYDNWFTATAGTGNSNISWSGSDASPVGGSLCAAGWRLPTVTEMRNLANVYGPTIFSSPANFDQNTSIYPYAVHYWTSTPSTDNNAVAFGIRSEIDYGDGTSQAFTYYDQSMYQYMTNSVRCLLGSSEESGTYQIVFMKNDGTSENTVQQVNIGEIVNLAANPWSRSGYVFANWNTAADGSGTSYADRESVSNLASQDEYIILYAQWRVANPYEPDSCADLGLPTMQNWLNTTLENQGDSTNLCDARDLSVYPVTKLQDGKVWMTKNLRLDFSDLKVPISVLNTNNPTSDFIALSALNPTSSVSWCGTTDNSCLNQINYNTSNIGDARTDRYGDTYDDYGVYYNYYAASAGNRVGLTSKATISGDLCPTGWRLPTVTEYRSLVQELISSSATDFSDSPQEFVRSGSFMIDNRTNTVQSNGDRMNQAFYWSSSSSGDYADALRFSTGNLSSASLSYYFDTSYRHFSGFTMRCLLDETAAERGTYQIIFYKNDGTSANVVQQVTVGSTINLAPNPWQRDGYTFSGWNTHPNGYGTPYSDTQSVTDLAERDGYILLYAQWEEEETESATCEDLSLPTMQNWVNTGLTNTGDTTTLCDSRDLTAYPVTMLADGKVWMTKNMRLDFSEYGDKVTSSNTHNPTADFLTYVNAKPTPNSTWCVSVDSLACRTQVYFNTINLGDTTTDSNGNTYDEYGVYYNWYAATAGNTNTNPAEGDLCPTGWHLPKGSDANTSNGEFNDLNEAMNGGSISSPAGLLAPPANFVYSGGYASSTTTNRGTQGSYWGSNWFTTVSNVAVLNISDVRVYPGTIARSPGTGASVRCILDDANNRPDYGTYQIIFDKNDGSGSTTVQQVNINDTVTLTANPWQRSGYTFTGWNTSADGTGTSYSDEESVTNLAARDEAIILYAQWEIITPQTCQDLGLPTMQNWRNTSLQNRGDSTTLCDARDLSAYDVTMLSDGNVWMTENLLITGTITSELSNFSGDDFDVCVGDLSSNSYDVANCRVGTDEANKKTVWYNYAAATAGTITGNINSDSASSDICPSGWQLPTKAQFSAISESGGTDHNDFAVLTPYFSPNYSGYYSNGNLVASGEWGYWWSATIGSYTERNFMRASSSSTYGSNTAEGKAYRYYGMSLRCMLSDSTYDAGTYQIIFDKNDGSGDTSVQQVNVGDTVTLTANPWQRDNYTFNGWNTSADGTGTSYADEEEVSNLASRDEAIVLYAQWEHIPQTCEDLNIPSMQNWVNSSLINTGDTINLCDSRDLSVYPVTKLADGSVWMAKNLRLEFTKLVEDISAENTNNPHDSFVSGDVIGLKNHSSTDDRSVWDYGGAQGLYTKYSAANIGGTDCPGGDCDIYGVYYSYNTVTAGNYRNRTASTTEVEGDICPAGWQLPSNSEINALSKDNNYYLPSENAVVNFVDSGWHQASATIAGHTSGNFIIERGEWGYYWSRSVASSNIYNIARYRSADGSFSSTAGRNSAYAVRCLMKDPTYDTGTYQIIFDKNDGSGDTSVQQVNVGDTVTLTTNPWTRDNYTFTGWNTAADGTGTTYADEESVTDLAGRDEAIVLYAQWELIARSCSDLGVPTMQNWVNSSLVNAGDTVDLCDSRDLTVYPVTKLADGNIWMAKNMRLDFNKLIEEISAANTDNPASGFTSNSIENRESAHRNAAWWGTGSRRCSGSPRYNTTNIGGTDCPSGDCDEYGMYYSVRAAFAGSTPVSDSSLCPAGWRIPTYQEFQALDSSQLSLGNFSLAGTLYGDVMYNVYNQGINGRGSSGQFWANSTDMAARVNKTYNSDSLYVGIGGGSYFCFGNAIRCVLKDPTYDAGTYQIIFDKNDGSGDTSVQQVNVGDTVTLTANPWQRDNYTFNGWNTSADGTGTSYADEESVTNLAARDEAIVLYAQWEATAPEEMQGWSCNLSTGDSTTLSDSRDGQTYTIAKLADGNCWMIDNLNLGATSLTTNLTSENSNLSTTITAATFNSWKKSNGYFNGTYTSGEYTPISGSDPVSLSKYGTRYNYYATSAGTIRGELGNPNAKYDICPSGWRLPTTAEVENLFVQYGYSASLSSEAKRALANNKIRAPLANGGIALALAGNTVPEWQPGTYDDEFGRTGYYWTSNTAGTLGYFWGCSFYTTGDILAIGTGGNVVQPIGHSIRCLLKDSSYDAGT